MKGKILVTGGTGYIGSHSTVELQNAGYEVVIIDNLSNSNIEVLDGIERITGKRPTFVQADCTDMEALRQLFKENPGIKGIIHFAASKAVGESVQKPLLYYRNNLMSLVNAGIWRRRNRIFIVLYRLRTTRRFTGRRIGSYQTCLIALRQHQTDLRRNY